MKYKITLNNRVYEVEVEAGKAMLLDEYEAVAPAAPAPVAAAPVAAAPATAPAAAPAAPVVTGAGETVAAPCPVLFSRSMSLFRSPSNSPVLKPVLSIRMYAADC